MVDHKKVTIRVKTGTSWVRIENAEIMYSLQYSSWMLDEPDYVQFISVVLPSWAESWRDMIEIYLKNNIEKVQYLSTIEVENV
jgi:hypothetical protein